MLVNGEVLRAHGGPAPLTGPRAPQVLDPAKDVGGDNDDDPYPAETFDVEV